MNADEYFECAEQVREALEQVAEGTATLRHVATETSDLYRGATMVAHLEAQVGSGDWSVLESETLAAWAEELEEAGRAAEAAEEFQMARQTR